MTFKQLTDAPIHYDDDEATAWAAGYNAGSEEVVPERETLAKGMYESMSVSAKTVPWEDSLYTRDIWLKHADSVLNLLGAS